MGVGSGTLSSHPPLWGPLRVGLGGQVCPAGDLVSCESPGSDLPSLRLRPPRELPGCLSPGPAFHPVQDVQPSGSVLPGRSLEGLPLSSLRILQLSPPEPRNRAWGSSSLGCGLFPGLPSTETPALASCLHRIFSTPTALGPFSEETEPQR